MKLTLAGQALVNITADDLQNLVDMEVGESRVIEYKLQLPEASPDGAIKFLAQVSSFANTGGGDIVFGIEADDGIPVAVQGLPNANIDQEILRLTQILQASVKPRLLGVEMRPVSTHAGPSCLVVRIPRSLIGPHVVEHGKHWRFYGRNSAGKYPLDVGEVRAAFLAGQEIADRVRAFRADRLMALAADQSPVPLSGPDRLILHIVSAGSFEARSTISIHVAERALMSRPLLLQLGSSTGRFTLDGCIRYSTEIGRDITTNYIQVFRNGIIEVVRSDIVQKTDRGSLLPMAAWEQLTMDILPSYSVSHGS
jgi:hypothetical protein